MLYVSKTLEAGTQFDLCCCSPAYASSVTAGGMIVAKKVFLHLSTALKQLHSTRVGHAVILHCAGLECVIAGMQPGMCSTQCALTADYHPILYVFFAGSDQCG